MHLANADTNESNYNNVVSSCAIQYCVGIARIVYDN